MRALLLACLFLMSLAAWADDAVIKVVPVQNLDVRMLCDQLVTGLKDFVPTGVEKVIGVLPNNSLLVKATNPQAMANFEAFLKTIDMPVPQVIVQVQLMQQRTEDVSAFGSNWEVAQSPFAAAGAVGAMPPPPSGLRYVRGSLQAITGGASAQSSARQVATTQIPVPSGGRGAIKLDQAGVTVQELIVSGVTVGADGTVTMQLDPHFRDGGVALTPGIVRAKSGQTMLLGGFTNRLVASDHSALAPPPAHAGAATDAGNEVFLYVTPTIVRADTTPAALAPFVMPPPVW